MADALRHLQQAIELLDDAGAPPNIAAHLDLAAHQLAAAIDSENGPDTDQLQSD